MQAIHETRIANAAKSPGRRGSHADGPVLFRRLHAMWEIGPNFFCLRKGLLLNLCGAIDLAFGVCLDPRTLWEAGLSTKSPSRHREAAAGMGQALKQRSRCLA